MHPIAQSLKLLADAETIPATAPSITPFGGLTIAGVIVLTVLIVGWFVLRYWVNVQRQMVDNVETPTIDRLNAKALDRMHNIALDEEEEIESEEQREAAPPDLLAVVPNDIDPIAVKSDADLEELKDVAAKNPPHPPTAPN
jgi:hypothetical protein